MSDKKARIQYWDMANGYFVRDYSVGNTIRKSAKSLLIPYFIVCMISTVWYTVEDWQRTGMDNLVHIKDKLIAMVLGMSRSSTILRDIHSVWLVWFVICLFAFLLREFFMLL